MKKLAICATVLSVVFLCFGTVFAQGPPRGGGPGGPGRGPGWGGPGPGRPGPGPGWGGPGRGPGWGAPAPPPPSYYHPGPAYHPAPPPPPYYGPRTYYRTYRSYPTYRPYYYDTYDYGSSGIYYTRPGVSLGVTF